MECAPGAGQVEVSDLTAFLGFRKMRAMSRQQRSHGIEFTRQVVQEYIAGETLYGLAKRHDLSRQLIRVWSRSTKPEAWTRMPKLLTSCMNTKPRSWRWSAWLAAWQMTVRIIKHEAVPQTGSLGPLASGTDQSSKPLLVVAS
jgi:hypothetical protein